MRNSMYSSWLEVILLVGVEDFLDLPHNVSKSVTGWKAFILRKKNTKNIFNIISLTVT